MNTVDVYHNVNPDPMRYLSGYKVGDPLTKVAVIVLPDGLEGFDSCCEWIWRLLNVGDDPDFGPPDPQAVAYRERRNRSLSMGDVLIFDGVAFGCATVGWERITVVPKQVGTTTTHGTTPLDQACHE